MATYTLFKLTILATLVGVLNPAIATSIPVVPMQLTDGCSTNSLATPDWLVHNYTSVGFMKSFSVLNRATNTSEEVVCPNPGPGGPGRCAATASWSGLSVMEVVQSSDGTSVRIGLSQTWTCNDVKPYVEPLQPLTKTNIEADKTEIQDLSSWPSETAPYH